jgi:hypothetical protein
MSGKKIALCVGINNYGGQNQLHGCVNDARTWMDVLRLKGYTVTPLLDEAATFQGIVQALTAMTKSLKYGDRLVFTYSGHGTNAPDTSGDEADGMDEAICPIDCFDKGMLFDDELQVILGSRALGTRVLMIMDSCHSGTVDKFLQVPSNVKSDFDMKPRFMPANAMRARVNPVHSKPRSLFRSITLLAGCLDNEYSYDAYINGLATGAFTYFASQALASNPGTYNAWQKQIRTSMPNPTYPQTPVLSGTTYQRSRVPFA